MSNQATSNSDAPAEAAAQTPRKTKRIFLKQPIMLRVCYALVPLMVAGIYFFGWRTAGLLVVCTAGGLITEWIMTRRQGAPISMACFVTCFLYALSLPPTMPLWMAVVGIVVALLFGKMVFGGFGRNFANPAIVGRVFVYVAFPNEMTGSFVPALRGWPGGFAHWSLATMEKAPEWLAGAARRGADALTSATPMWSRRDFDFQTPIKNLFLGNIGGTFEAQHETRVLAAGSVGEVCALLIILAGVYLIITRTANWRLTAGTVAGAVIANIVFRNLGGADAVPPLEFTL
ncbi:MAG: RnfABCDGE type electron transport complex subunit D, partial [Planctomycetia bacterium]|nr:RnfABCDGE type electron transport complex subunit D [Planctomycetia bacterium]